MTLSQQIQASTESRMAMPLDEYLEVRERWLNGIYAHWAAEEAWRAECAKKWWWQRKPPYPEYTPVW